MKNPIRILARLLFTAVLLFSVLAPLHVSARDMTPEEYAEKVQGYFAEEQWEEEM